MMMIRGQRDGLRLNAVGKALSLEVLQYPPARNKELGVKAEPHESSRAVPDLYLQVILWEGLRGTRARYSMNLRWQQEL